MSDIDSKNNQNPPTPPESATGEKPFPDNLKPEDQVREALRAVADPEIGLNVVQLGLIREILLDQEEPEIKMMLTTPFCPYGGWLIQQVKDTAQQVVGKQIKMTVLPDLWDPNYMEDPGLLMGW
jgi:metal-sulfur cluster biosynthetic enzyme